MVMTMALKLYSHLEASPVGRGVWFKVKASSRRLVEGRYYFNNKVGMMVSSQPVCQSGNNQTPNAMVQSFLRPVPLSSHNS
jgi:hypothetical protein